VDLTSVCAAFGLSAAAGLNAWLPLFGAALAQRLDLVDLAQPFDDLSGSGALVVLGVLTIADFVGDKIPAVDHVLHAIGTVVAPVSGAALFTGQTGADTDLSTVAAVLLGGSVAASIHAGRATIRPISTVGTAGIGNPVLSLVEDVGALGLTLAAFVVPVLAALAVIALVVLILLAWRRRPRRAAPQVESPRPNSR
jgi:Domain of unknown function (DUF4126)